MDRYDAIPFAILLCLLLLALATGHDNWWVFAVTLVLVAGIEAWRTWAPTRFRRSAR